MSVIEQPPGSLAQAAAAFESELAHYEHLTSELGRARVRSEASLSSTQRLLSESSACEEALSAQLGALLEALHGARETQARCTECTLEAARVLQARAHQFTALLERVAALGQRARETSEPAARVLAASSDGPRSEELASSLAELGRQMAALVREAESVVVEADQGDWPEVSHDVGNLKLQMETIAERLVQAAGSLNDRGGL